MAPSVDYAEPEPPPMPVIEAVAAPKPSGPVDSPWERLEVQRTAIETVKPPDELVRPSGPPGIICPACRTENEATRRFCQSCGTPLVLTAPVQPVTPRPARRSWRWVLVLIPIIIIAALIGFGGAAFLKNGLPTPSSTVAPPGSIASGAAPGSLVPASSSEPSVHLLRLHTIVGSGKIDQAHSSGKSIDNDVATSWQVDTKAGNKIWLDFTFVGSGVVDVSKITITSGDQRSGAAFKASRRPRHIEITVDGGAPVKFVLLDQFGEQDVDVEVHVTKTLRVAVVDSFAGDSTTFSGISEIRFTGSAAP